MNLLPVAKAYAREALRVIKRRREREARKDWILVPRNPTQEMLQAGSTAPHDERAHLSGCQTAAVWYAMLDALEDEAVQP